MSQRNRILLIVSVFVAVIIGIIIYALIPRATILFNVAPDEFTVKINGSAHKIKTGESITVAPGDLSIEVSRDEFDTYTEKISLKNGEQHEVLYALNPLTDAARQLLTSEKSRLVIERIGGKKVQEGAKKLDDTYPLIKELPIKYRYYTITTCDSEKYPDDPDKIAICVELYDLEAKQTAIEDIESRGYKLSDYEVIFQDQTYEALQEEAGE